MRMVQHPKPTGAFPTIDRVRLGITRGELQGPRYRRVHRGVHVPRDEPMSLEDRCRALGLVLGSDAVFSHHTAAALHGAPVPDEPLLHISITGSVEPRIDGVVCHRLQNLGPPHTFNGLRITSPARTFVDLAAFLDLNNLVCTGDALAAREPAGVAALREQILNGSGRRGVRLARRAVELINPRSRSYMESKLRLMLVLAGLPEPDVNEDVYDSAGNYVACPDLAWRLVLLALQYEGNHHRIDPRQWHRDIGRDERMVEIGWTVLRITADDVNVSPAATIVRIRRTFDRLSGRRAA
jgi:very-short-patch-repair endonuclease